MIKRISFNDGYTNSVTPSAIIPAGRGIFTGTAVPDNADQHDGDIYLRSNGTIYLKVAGVWVVSSTTMSDIMADAVTATNNANTATGLANTATSNANTATSAATTATGLANTATSNANAATSAASTATGLANTATSNANAATSAATTATGLANTATSNANTATSAANTATTNANTAASNANAAAATLSATVFLKDKIHLASNISNNSWVTLPSSLTYYNNKISVSLNGMLFTEGDDYVLDSASGARTQIQIIWGDLVIGDTLSFTIYN